MGYFDHWYDYAMPSIPLYNQGKSIATGLSGPDSSGLTNALEGDPAGYATALKGLQDTANTQAEKVKNFLLGREQNAQQTYRPMQQLFANMYGTGGLMPAQAPSVPGSGKAF